MATFTGLSLPPKALAPPPAPRQPLAAAAAAAVAALAPPPALRRGGSGEPGLWGSRRELRSGRRGGGGGRGPLVLVAAAVDGEYSSRRSSSSEPRETIMLPGCDYNHWLIVMDFPKDPAPTREQMIDTYLNTLATVVGSMEEAKKNMYAFSTTTYTGFQCTVDEATSEKFKGLPGVVWVLPDSYIDVKNKDYGGDKYINGEIVPCQYPTYQPKPRNNSRYESRRYERKRDGPPRQRPRPKQEATSTESSSA